jgi:hypothetical protein
MEQILLTLFNYALEFARLTASTLVDQENTQLFFLTTLAVLAPLGFILSYLFFQIPMIIGDGLTRNIPVLGVMFYRHMALLVILLASYAVAVGFIDLFGEFLPATVSNAHLKLGAIAVLSLVLVTTSYKKLENLLSATFYWKRSFGLLDLICLASSSWILLKIMPPLA